MPKKNLTSETYNFYGANGNILHGIHYKSTQTKCVVLVVQGRNELYLKYDETYLELMNNNCDVYVYDHRYQGFNERPYPKKEVCHIDSFDTYVNDLEKVIGQLPKGFPIFIMAISMGAAITLLYLLKKKKTESICGQILISPLLEPKLEHNYYLTKYFAKFKYVINKVTKKLANPIKKEEAIFKPRVFGVNANTHDENKHNAYFELYNKYPQCRSGTPSASWVLAMLKAIKEIKNNNINLDIPTVVIYGENDNIIKPSAVEEFIKKYENEGAIIQDICIPNCYHDVLIEQKDIRNFAVFNIITFIQNTIRKRLSKNN